MSSKDTQIESARNTDPICKLFDLLYQVDRRLKSEKISKEEKGND